MISIHDTPRAGAQTAIEELDWPLCVTDIALDLRQANCLYQIGRMLVDDREAQVILDAVTQAAHHFTGAQATTLSVLEDDGKLVKYVGRGVDVADDDSAQHTRLALPLTWHSEALGVLCLTFASSAPVSPETLALVEALAEQAAAAVKRSHDQAEMLRLRAESDEIARQFAEHTDQLERIQLQLVQNEKLTAIGQLIQGFAHDINTPLSVVITNLSVLKGHTENLGTIAQAALDLLPDLENTASLAVLNDAVRGADLEYTLEDLPELMKESTMAARRIADLVRSIANFARKDTSPPSLVDMNDVLESALNLASNPLKQSASTLRDFSATPPVFGLSSELSELFVHLLINAANALEDRAGTVTVSTAHEADNVVVRIRDTGVGIPADNLVRVFDPFFTTNAVGGHTGMGLAVCYGIVARHAGSITIDSEPGAGTTVTISLPAAQTGQVAA
jgi:two-component system NtrC family sensor kinase